jgi:dsDNA-specific endonuclease/ATPase MutS2
VKLLESLLHTTLTLKILANELPFATNANMMFDEKTLEPMYKLRWDKQEVPLHLR